MFYFILFYFLNHFTGKQMKLQFEEAVWILLKPKQAYAREKKISFLFTCIHDFFLMRRCSFAKYK